MQRNRVHRFEIQKHVEGIAAGATLGQQHLRMILDRLPTGLTCATTLLLDFDGIEGVTPSYVKAFLVPLLTAAGQERQARAPAHDAAQIEIFVANMSDDIREDLDAALLSAGRPCLEALEWQGEIVRRARMHGPIEGKIEAAFEYLLAAGRGTATRLRGFDESIGVSGWHYRLVELQKLGLVRRIKVGRSWVYEPVVLEVTRG